MVVSGIGLIALLRRMRAVRERLAAVLASEARFRSLVQQGGDVTLIATADGRVTYASPSVVGLAGRSTRDVEGEPLASFVHPDDAAALGRFLKAAAEGLPATTEWRLKRGDEWVWTEADAVDLRSEPAIDGLVITLRDISERRSLEARLTHQAYHDSLTRLANRSLFLNRVAHAIARYPRDQKPAAVLFLDLDGFKKVNDSLGHAAGDELLVACAARLAACIRPGDTIARLGGDEFAVLLEGIAGMSDAETIAGRIAHAVAGSFTIQGREVFVGVSTGIAEISAGLTPDEV
ncbi:MAG: GGDEF domain-containing protein, partial [Gemmatimonadetes bacterium]|nr:GGDEF domain-containing protein [Gemmatimonadota bacterium]